MDGHDAQARDDDAGDTATAAGSARQAPDQEQFLRELLQRQMDQAQARGDALRLRDGGDGSGKDDSQDSQDEGQTPQGNLGMQVLHQAQVVAQQAIEQPGAAGQASLAPALAELIERHVKQLLVPDTQGRSAAQSREIMITLKDGLLPDTQLWLSRTDTGWSLRADTRSDAAYRSMIEGAPALIERFANSRLGSLDVQPVRLG